ESSYGRCTSSCVARHSGIDSLSSLLSFFPQLHPVIQLARLLSLATSGFSWTSRRGRGLPPANVVCLSLWDRGGDCDGGVESSPEFSLRLDVSLRMPGKFPLEEGA